MQILDFPFCCTGKILVDFGGTHISEGKKFTIPPEKIKREVISFLNNQKAYSMHAFVCATTNSEQKEANFVLKELKFHCSRWMSKNQHPETKVRIWWMPLSEWEGAKNLL